MRVSAFLAAVRRSDPRYWQMAVLGGLLAGGKARLGFDVGALQIAVTLATALAVQALGTAAFRLPRFDPRSALITGLSLCILLRTNHPRVAALAATIAIGSKFLLRLDGRHVWNPANLGIVAAMTLTGAAWVSPGQWGSGAWMAVLFACLGGLVVQRSARSDVTVAYLAFHLALLSGRSLWLGEPLAIALHRAESGALLLFAFFMISDPKTTPDTRAGRLLFAGLVAAGAYFVQFVLFRANGLLWSLAVLSPVVPLLNRFLPGARYDWAHPSGKEIPREDPLACAPRSLLPPLAG